VSCERSQRDAVAAAPPVFRWCSSRRGGSFPLWFRAGENGAKFTLSVSGERGSFAPFSRKEILTMPYAVFTTGGKQYRVAEGDIIDVEKLDAEVGGDAITFSDVLFFNDGNSTKIGSDLSGATVKAEVLGQLKAKKVIAYKYRRRKGYHRTVGHRRKITRLKITGISA
jgi:large subunit ribosomal protein L21